MLHRLLTVRGCPRLWWGALSIALISFSLSLLGSSAASVQALDTHSADAQSAVSQTAHSDILRAIAPLQIVYLAETHDDLADHAAQLEIVRALADNEIAIALEMFQRPFQLALDAYLAGELSEAALIAQSEYDTRWGYDWEFYAPILRYAKANQIPLIALNTPTEVTQKVARAGLEGLGGEDLTHIPPLADIDTSNAAYRAQIAEAFSAHGDVGHSLNFDNFWAAQVLWDETMAERIVQQLAAQPNRKVVVLAGEGHIAYGYGIPNRVARRLPTVTQASVMLMSADQALANPASDNLSGNLSTAPKLTDFVWLTDGH